MYIWIIIDKNCDKYINNNLVFDLWEKKKTKLRLSLLRVFDFVVTHRNDIAPKTTTALFRERPFSSNINVI